MRRGGLACLRRSLPRHAPTTRAARCAGDASQGDGFELPADIKWRLTKQLKSLYPKKKPVVKGKRSTSDSQMDDEYPVKITDLKHAEEDAVSTDALRHVVQHKDVVKALGKKKRRAAAQAALQKESGWQVQPKGRLETGEDRKTEARPGKTAISVREAKAIVADGESLLQGQIKRDVPLEHLDPEDRVILHGRAPAALEAKDSLDVDSLAFVLGAALDTSKKPWERSGNPYDKTRLRGLLDAKIRLDKLQARLGEIETQDDTKLAPEYNYLKLRGRHLFHTYLDDLATLRKDLLEGLVEESFEEWTMFERHESMRMDRITAKHAAAESAPPALAKPAAKAALVEGSSTATAVPATEAVAETAAPADAATGPPAAQGKKKKSKKLSARAREKRFKARMEKKEVEEYMQGLRSEALEDDVRQETARVQAAEAQPKLIWGTLPPGPEHLEYQCHVQGTDEFKGWAWRRPVYYVPRIPWREREIKAAKGKGGHPYVVDDLELPKNWEENYDHFPYYKRQELWENPKLLSPLPSTEPDWPHRDQDFLDVYLSKTEFVHPGDWDVKLGKRKPSKYRTLQNSIFHQKHYMSPYENADFDKFMADPTNVPSHRLGMDLLGF